jgi:hypothetical protein
MEFCSRGHRLQPNNLYTIKAAITHFNLGLPRIPGPYFEFASGPKEAAPSSGKIHGALVLPLGAIGKLSTVIIRQIAICSRLREPIFPHCISV